MKMEIPRVDGYIAVTTIQEKIVVEYLLQVG